jgi:hypothetical protein
LIGLVFGFVVELARKLIKRAAAYRRFVASGKRGEATDFCLDAFFLPSPYAFSFGGFVNLPTSLWFGVGGIVSSLFNSLRPAPKQDGTPSDMSTTSLVGGGLIAGDALAALGLGVVGLLALV